MRRSSVPPPPWAKESFAFVGHTAKRGFPTLSYSELRKQGRKVYAVDPSVDSIEGDRGFPRIRPPYPVEKGLRGQPTVINNVKTFASVVPIVRQGADWYRSMGTEKSPGTAVFSVVGDVVHPGLVEVPMGVDLGTLILEICGGIPHQKAFKAVQIGGPSGGCLPDRFLGTPIDFDSLTAAGAMMGSGGMVVMDENACMVDVARYFLDFTQKESCGKCTFCRIGTKHLLHILERITRGEGREADLEVLENLSRDVQLGSLCGLGKTAPNPVITSLRYFREEYQAHVREKRCPAGMCRRLTAYFIDLDRCARGCEACVGSCPVEAIFTTKNRKKAVDQSLCVKCGECMAACPVEYSAVKKISPAGLAPVSLTHTLYCRDQSSGCHTCEFCLCCALLLANFHQHLLR